MTRRLSKLEQKRNEIVRRADKRRAAEAAWKAASRKYRPKKSERLSYQFITKEGVPTKRRSVGGFWVYVKGNGGKVALHAWREKVKPVRRQEFSPIRGRGRIKARRKYVAEISVRQTGPILKGRGDAGVSLERLHDASHAQLADLVSAAGNYILTARITTRLEDGTERQQDFSAQIGIGRRRDGSWVFPAPAAFHNWFWKVFYRQAAFALDGPEFVTPGSWQHVMRLRFKGKAVNKGKSPKNWKVQLPRGEWVKWKKHDWQRVTITRIEFEWAKQIVTTK